MRPEERLPYLAPLDHPQRSGPNGASVIVWPVVNVENWLIDNAMPRQALVAPTGAALKPDVANWGWHEYGMRVGFWRLHDAFYKRGLKPTLSINGSVCDAYPRVAGAVRAPRYRPAAGPHGLQLVQRVRLRRPRGRGRGFRP